MFYLERRWIVRDWNLAAEVRNKGEMNEEWRRGAEEEEERSELCNKKTCLHAAKGDMDRDGEERAEYVKKSPKRVASCHTRQRDVCAGRKVRLCGMFTFWSLHVVSLLAFFFIMRCVDGLWFLNYIWNDTDRLPMLALALASCSAARCLDSLRFSVFFFLISSIFFSITAFLACSRSATFFSLSLTLALILPCVNRTARKASRVG